jgi:hypothetical protein
LRQSALHSHTFCIIYKLQNNKTRNKTCTVLVSQDGEKDEKEEEEEDIGGD